MHPTSLAVTPTAPGADAPDAPAAPALTLAADTRSVSQRTANLGDSVKVALRILVLVLSVVGFLASHADNIPRVRAMLLSEYDAAVRGVEALWSGEHLEPPDSRFDAIAGVFMDIAAEQLTAQEIGGTVVERILSPEGYTLGGADAIRPMVRLEFVLSDGAVIPYPLGRIEQRVDAILPARLFGIGKVIFGLLLVAEIASVLLAWRRRQQATPH